PRALSETTDDGLTEPRALSETHDGGSTEPRALSETPDGRSTEPRALSETTDDRLTEPRALSETPDGGSTGPRALSETPDDRSTEPRALSETPDGVSTEPRARSETTDDGLTEPRALSETPDGGSTEPRALSETPDGVSTEPRALSETTDDGLTEPRALSETPEGGSTDPRALSETPDGGSTEPKAPSETAEGGSTEPRALSETTEGGSTEPTALSETPDGASTEPRALSETPDGRSTEPRTLSETTDGGSTEPSALSETPDDRSTEPSALSETPDGGSTKPRALSETTDGESTEPRALAETPDDRSTEPSALSETTDGGSTEPSALSETPDGGSTEPRALSETPDGGSTEPRALSETTDGESTEPRALAETPDDRSTEPSALSETTDGGSTEPSALSETPDGGSTEPRALSETPDGVSTEPRALSETTDGGSTEPRALSETPDGRSTEPRALSETTDDRLTEPRALSETPDGGSTEPRALSETTDGGSTEPRALSETTDGGSTEPRALSETPDGRSTEPRALSETTDDGLTEPRALSETPDGGSTEPRALSETPDGGSTEPRALSATPDGGSTEPSALSETPDGGSTEPRALSETTDGGSTEPRALSETTDGGSTEPRALSETTKGGSTEPRALSETTDGGSTEPRALSETPDGGSTEPRALSATPDGGSTEPKALSETADGGSTEPRALSETTDGGSTEPRALAETPDDRSTEPSALSETPDGGSTEPRALSETTDGGSTEPRALSETTDGGSTEPRALSETTEGGSTEPSALSVTPDGGSTEPGALSETPDGGSTEPRALSETTDGGSTEPRALSETTDGGPTEPSALPDDQTENHFKLSEEPDVTRTVSDEDGEEKADLVTVFAESPEPSMGSQVAQDDHTVVGQQQLLEVEAKQRTEEVSVEEKEHSNFLIEGSDDVYRKGSEDMDPEGRQEVVGTEEEITKEGAASGRETVYMEEKNAVKNQQVQNDELQEVKFHHIRKKEEEEEGGGEVSVIQDKELKYSEGSMNYTTEAETAFNRPEHRPELCSVDTGTRDTGVSLSTSSDEDGEDGDDGEGGVCTPLSAGIDSPGVALTWKAESNNEQEMSEELRNVSPGTFSGSGAGPCGPNSGLIPEVNNGHVAAAAETTEQRALMGRDSEERWVTSQLLHAHSYCGFKYVPGLGEVDHSQREYRDTTLKSWEGEDTAAGPDMILDWSVDSEIIVDSGAPWGIEERMSGRAERATGQGGRGRTGPSDEQRSGHEAHKTDGEDFKTEEPLFEFTSDRERRGSTGAEAAAVLGSIWYDNIAMQEDILSCEEIFTLPDTAIQNTPEACEGESTTAPMTEENDGQTLSQTEDYVEAEPIDHPIENQIKSFEDGQTETEDLVTHISVAAMGKDVSNAGSKETTAESVQQKNTGQSNHSTEETVEPASLTDMTSDLLMQVRRDPLDELLESTSRVTEPTETSTQGKIEPTVKAAEGGSALAFGLVTEADEEIQKMWVEVVLPDDDDDDDDDDDEAADKTSKTHETPNHQSNFEEQIQHPDELMKMSVQIEGEQPPESYSGKSGLVETLGISAVLEAPECEDSEHISGGEGTPESEGSTTRTERIGLSEELMTAPPGFVDVSPHSFTEKRPTHSTSPQQHHHLAQTSEKLINNEVVLSQVEQDDLLYQSQINAETSIKVEATEIDPEVSVVAKSSDAAADHGKDEPSAISVPVPSSVDEDCMKPDAEDPSHLLPDVKLSEPSFPLEVDSVVLRDRRGHGGSVQGPHLDSKHPLHKLSSMNQACSRRSEFIDSPSPDLSAEERARQRHSLQFELNINVLDLTVQKSRILVKNPGTRPPTDPRALLQMPSLEPTPTHTSSPQRALPLAGRPIGGLGIGIKLPGFGAGFPALRKTQKVVKERDDCVPEKSEPQPGMMNMSPKPTVAKSKPRWTPPKHPGFGNPLMSELKSKLKKPSQE
ncbi:hypothetical protein NHX12_025290, partial [Muraenolepis orangiensis]